MKQEELANSADAVGEEATKKRRLITGEGAVSVITVLILVALWTALTDSYIDDLYFPSPMDTIQVVGRMEACWSATSWRRCIAWWWAC